VGESEEPSSTLLKVAALNQLYGTNVYAVGRMAEYVVLLMREGPPAAELEIVDRIAELPKTTEQKRDRLHLSFASKLAHFFIDPERFPIYDQYAARALAFHTGKRVIKERGMRYADYCEPFEKLRSAVGVKPRELDQYLWLRGPLPQMEEILSSM
jgi:hypothetical protein